MKRRRRSKAPITAQVVPAPPKEDLDRALHRLFTAVALQRSRFYCLKLWSAFVRLRDGGCCVLCSGSEGVSAHHIVRRSFIPQMQFETGNGISLCRSCHTEPHRAFNRKPDLLLPMDCEGGENIELMMRLFGTLAHDAAERGLMRDDYYFLSDNALRTFKTFQSIDPDLAFPGCRIEQAALIWRQTPRGMLNAILRSESIQLPPDFIQLGSMVVLSFDGQKTSFRNLDEQSPTSAAELRS